MATKKAAEEAEEMTAAETVTVSKADFEALLNDMKLMKQQLASEDRLKSAKEQQLIADEEARKRAEEGNARAMELTDVHVDLGNLRGSKNVEVSINGKQYVIPRGKTVQVPRCVAEVIENARKQREIAYGLQEQRADELMKSAAAYA